MLIGVSPDHLYFKGKTPRMVSDYHKPYFLVFTPKSLDIKHARLNLIKKIEENKSDQDPLSKIESVGEIETYNSFWSFDKKIPVFKVFTDKSYHVPEVSDYLFFNHGLFTAEHDIPYQQRALVDLCVEKDLWLFNTNSNVKKLGVLVYDIETIDYSEGKEDIPIDIIGFSGFEVKITSKASLTDEDFSFDIIDIPRSWEDFEVEQVVSRNVDEEIDNIFMFCKKLTGFDIISGHNIIGFDNYLVYNRIKWFLKNYLDRLSPEKIKVFQDFISHYSRTDKTFHFGVHSEAVQFYPCTLDTYHGTRKFYSFLNDFSLKSVAPFLGVEIKDRITLAPSQIKIDSRTLKYNKQDVQEQLGVTLNIIQQALPLCFTTCMPFDMLLSSGAVGMWDHMSLIRAKIQKKIMPPICRVLSISQTLVKYFKGCNSKEEIISRAKDRKEQLSKDFIRVLKYGEEMPPWVEDPYIIYNEHAKDDDDILSYHMPGGMTIKPDKDANSHFIPWYYVIVADVGAMYPTILKALNIGADTVRLAKKDEKPDEFIWLKKIPLEFLKKRNIWYRKVTEKDVFADKGYILGIKIDKKPGVVNRSMTSIMNMISKTKKELKQTSKTGNKKELERLKMMYQSLKGARNAGSVDYSQRIILIDPNGRINNIKIGEFVDNMINKYGFRVENINGVEFEVADVKDNWHAFSVNKHGKVEIKRIKQAVRHKWNGKLVKICTKNGSATVTQNHSIFTITDGKIEQISSGEINEDTLIAHAGSIPQIEEKQEINLIEEICEPGFYAFVAGEDLDQFDGFKEELLHCNVHTLPTYVRIPIEKLRNMNLPPHLLRYITVGTNWRKSSRIPAVIPVDKNLAELLGYYISEGHTYIKFKNGNPYYYITFSSSSKQMHKRIQQLFNTTFRIPVYTLNRTQTTGSIVSTVHARIIDYLFQKILSCGTNSRNKRIPSQILSAPHNVKKAFLEAYMKGDGNYKTEMPSSVPHGRFTTNSRSLDEDIIVLQRQFGMKTNTYYRERDNTYNTRMIGYFKGRKELLGDCFAVPPKKVELVDPTSEYVYDISVEDNENFLTSDGCIILHNTHGILSAPGVSGRQFNLWGAAAITTKGQQILSDTLDYLKNKKIRVVYGDTDGICIGCSKSAGNIPGFSKNLGVEIPEDEKDWLVKPEDALKAIKECDTKWENKLNYPDFELEPEVHDAMIFVKHKNYLIFDSKDSEIEMITKGNNFKGSDKANIARKTLKQIMIDVLRENPRWGDEEEARKNVKLSIMEKTNEILSKLDLKKVDLEDLTLVQSVQPSKRYKLNQDGSMSTFGKRSAALEKLLGYPIKTRIKLKFVVTKHPLPGIKNPSKSGVKPIDYMYPVEYLKSYEDIDLEWYKKMIKNYVQGAFGLSGIAATEQTGLDAWM